MTVPRYLGTWTLVPELCLYEGGTPPSSGAYCIVPGPAGTLAIDVTWRMPGDDTDRTTRFGGPADGTPIALGGPAGAPDTFTLTHVDEATLDSAAFVGATRVAYARRVAAADGALLAVVQESLGSDGRATRNFQLYRRAGSRT